MLHILITVAVLVGFLLFVRCVYGLCKRRNIPIDPDD
jgi:hypothetical protein